MVESNLRIQSIQILDDFLTERISATEASDWALKIIASSQWEHLKPDLQRVIHTIFDLHDTMQDEKWVPTKVDLKQLKHELESSKET